MWSLLWFLLFSRFSIIDIIYVHVLGFGILVRSDREREFVKHLVEREIMLRRSCSRLSKNIGPLGDLPRFDINGSSAPPWGGVGEFAHDIIRRRVYAIEEIVESEFKESRWSVLEILSMRIPRVIRLDVLV